MFDAPSWQPNGARRGKWPVIGSLVRVTRSGVRQGEPYGRTGFYVTSRRCGAEALGEVIRSHWHVENRLHWCKDVLMSEDAGQVRSLAGASVLSAVRSAALSVLRKGGHWSPTAARSRLANRVAKMAKLLRS